MRNNNKNNFNKNYVDIDLVESYMDGKTKKKVEDKLKEKHNQDKQIDS